MVTMGNIDFTAYSLNVLANGGKVLAVYEVSGTVFVQFDRFRGARDFAIGRVGERLADSALKWHRRAGIETSA
jgi:hypothetical protein